MIKAWTKVSAEIPETDTFGYAEFCINGKTQICKFYGSVPGDSN